MNHHPVSPSSSLTPTVLYTFNDTKDGLKISCPSFGREFSLYIVSLFQAYMRPPLKTTAVQIARICAFTLITMSVVLGSFILAASWVQARASCTPESIATMQAELKLRQQQAAGTYQPQGEFLKHLQPEALVQVGAKFE